MNLEDYLQNNKELGGRLKKGAKAAESAMRERIKHVRSPLSFKEPPNIDPIKLKKQVARSARKFKRRGSLLKIVGILGLVVGVSSLFRRLKRQTGKPLDVNELVEEKEEEKVEIMASKTYTDTDSSKVMFAKDAYEGYRALGLNHDAAVQMAGQDAHESGWGTKQTGSWNFGGIKFVGKGEEGIDYSWVRTTEYATEAVKDANVKSGEWRNVKKIANNQWSVEAKFRNYKSYADFAKRKVDMLKGERYGVTNEDSAATIRDKLVKGGYATAPEYKKRMEDAHYSITKRLKIAEAAEIEQKQKEQQVAAAQQTAKANMTISKGGDRVSCTEYITELGSDITPKATTL